MTRIKLIILFLSILLATVLAPRPTRADDPALSVDGSATYAYPGGETSYRIELLNHTDQIVYDGVISITLPISFTYVPGSTQAMGEGWPLTTHEPAITGQTLTWGPYHMPAAGVEGHNPYGIHTMVYFCENAPPGLHLDGAKMLVGNGGYVTQLFYPIDTTTTGPSECAINFVVEAYARNLIPILRLQGNFDGKWQAPSPGAKGDYAEIAQAYANFVAGLPRRDTNPLYIAVWNEPNLWIEWSGQPDATQYARFFVAVSNAIRKLGDARIRVVNGAVVPSSGYMSFTQQMLAVPGFRDAFDVWASHCYPYNHPAAYNIHNGTARYGEYAIDCYLRELNLISQAGRSGVKVMLTETGYELGNNTFGFEGYSSINEDNRAAYITSAFADYWQKWPEVVAVTPFEMCDTSGQWAKFDWVYPYWPFPKHQQFDAVAALPKPGGQLRPYGYQINFRAKIDPSVAPGTYTSELSGSARDGYTAFAAESAPVQVWPAGALQSTYLPLIFGPRRTDGPWTMAVGSTQPPGVIVPTYFLQPTQPAGLTALTVAPALTSLSLPGEPQRLVLDDESGLGAVIFTDAEGHTSLQAFNLESLQALHIIQLDSLQQLSSDAPAPGQIYVSLADSLALVDLHSGQIIHQLTGLGRLAGLARDPLTGRLFVADPGQDQLLVFKDDLSRLVTAIKFSHQPNHVLADPNSRRVYISFPAAPQVLAIDADALTITAQADLMAGPIFDLAFDPARQRLYALHALAPDYHGLSVWSTPALSPVAVVGGARDFLLRTASALALTPSGGLLVAEADGLWRIAPADFTVSNAYPAAPNPTAGGLKVGHLGGVYVLDTRTSQLRLYQGE